MARKRAVKDEAGSVNDAAPFIEEIRRGTEEEVERVLTRARRTAESRLEAAKEQANAEVERVLDVARDRAEIERRRISSDLNLEKKKLVLKARGEIVEEVLARVGARLAAIRGTPAYRELLKGLILEGIAALDRAGVHVSVSAADAGLANEAFVKEVARACGRAVTLTTAADLGDEVMGAIVRAADGSVLYDNTIGARMERLSDELQLIVSREVFADEAP